VSTIGFLRVLWTAVKLRGENPLQGKELLGWREREFRKEGEACLARLLSVNVNYNQYYQAHWKMDNGPGNKSAWAVHFCWELICSSARLH
jgi:hypothetical protein